MILRTQKQIKKMSFVLIILVVLINMHVIPVMGGECENGFKKCILIGIAYNFPFHPSGIVSHAVYCSLGYAFCIRYIER